MISQNNQVLVFAMPFGVESSPVGMISSVTL